MEYRRVFDTVPELFDRFRPRYSPELFADFIETAGIGPGVTVLELGPGTGQATDPVLETGCDYHAIELGEHLAAKMEEKYGKYPNFHIVNDDFITHDFGQMKFDVIYSAATIQWIPEEVAFSKTYELLRPGGYLAMMLLQENDYRSANEEMYAEIQELYDRYYYKYSVQYRNMKAPFDYRHATDYGYTDFTYRDYHGVRVFTADEYVAYCGTHSDHIVIPEPYKTEFFEGLRDVARRFGNRVEYRDTYRLYLARKPL